MTSKSVQQALQLFRLNRDIRHAFGPTGQGLGNRQGHSVEFHEFRAYVPGDDPRHVDWSAYARTGDLTVRLYREEVSPHVDVVMDTSCSMGIDDGRKAELAIELAEFCVKSGQQSQGSACLSLAGESFLHNVRFGNIQLNAKSSCLFSEPALCVSRLKTRSLRVVISDFLTPQPVDETLRLLAAHGARLIIIMLLGPWEAQPVPGDFKTLVDAEQGGDLPLHLSPAHCQRYLKRLNRLRQLLSQTCERSGNVFVEIHADQTLLSALRENCLPRDIVRAV